MTKRYQKRKPSGKQKQKKKVNRNYKDRLFRFIFGNHKHKDWALNLYNAVENKEYTDPEDLEIVTLDNAVYMHMRNDVSLLVASWTFFFAEHQTTVNPNIPYRYLGYCASTYSEFTSALDNFNPYGRIPVKLLEPKFYVFYNGTEKADTINILKLSDLYYNKSEKPMLELIVKQLNINGYRGKCVQLFEYEWFVEAVRTNCETMNIEQAVNKALDHMPKDFSIREFLLLNRSEVMDMSIFEYDEEKHMRLLRAEGREEGRAEGREEGRAEGREEGRTEGIAEGRLRNMVDLITRKINASGMNFEDACKDLMLNEEEIASVRAYTAEHKNG